MNTSFVSACLVWSIMAIAPLISSAQEVHPKKAQLTLPPGTNEAITNAATRKEINIKAVRDFVKNFPVTNESWYKLKDGFMARFMLYDIQYKVYYNTAGVRVCVLQLYKESHLSQDILLLVKPTYWDYTIYNVAEVNYLTKTVYFIYLKNNSMYKTLRIVNGEMEVVNEFLNAGAE